MWRHAWQECRNAYDDCPARSVVAPIAVGASGILLYWLLRRKKVRTIEMGDGWWGAGERPVTVVEDESVRPCQVQTSDAEIEDLHRRLDQARFTPPLENAKFHYGFNSLYLRKVVSYWRNKFDWKKQVELLNRYPHFKTTIEGIEVHFIHVKPARLPAGQEAKPLLMVHGWPGSFYEFYHILPLLTDPAAHGLCNDVIFEVICPSIPGYGFSEAPHKMGFDALAAARVLYKLMKRLGFQQFYLQGGDWGSRISTLISQMQPECVKGLHLNFFPPERGGFGALFAILVGRYVPWLVGFTKEDVRGVFPYFEKSFYGIMLESGYLHIQATKPETVGCGLNDSPVGLAAYILEKVSTGTNPAFRDLDDGGLERKFCLDDLLTNVMIYWVNGSIVSSMRLYKETFTRDFYKTPNTRVGVYVPTGLAAFPNEVVYCPRVWAKRKYKNIITYSHMPRGGHFAALEEPELFARDLHSFVVKVEKK